MDHKPKPRAKTIKRLEEKITRYFRPWASKVLLRPVTAETLIDEN